MVYTICHLFMVIWGMVYYCFNHITCNYMVPGPIDGRMVLGSFSSTKMSFSLQRNVIFLMLTLKNRVLKISKTTSFFDISSCFFGIAALFISFFSQKRFIALTALQSSSEKPVRCQWSQRFSPTATQDKLFQFRVFFCVDSIIQPSWKGLSTICQRFASLPQWTRKKRRFFAFVWSILCFYETLWHVWFWNFWHVTSKHGFHLQKQWCAWRCVCKCKRRSP